MLKISWLVFQVGGNAPRFSAFSEYDDIGGTYLTPHGAASPVDSQGSKPLPQTPSTRPSSFFNVPPSQGNPSSILQGEPTQIVREIPQDQSAARPLPVHSDTTGSARGFIAIGQTNSQVSTLPAERQPPRSFIHDVANLLDTLTATFAAHPELSEGLRNIVRGATTGAYWADESERVANAANTIQRAAQETSVRINQVADEVRLGTEQEAGMRIAQSLAGVFKVIGELSGGIAGQSSEQQPTVPQFTTGTQPHAQPLHQQPIGWTVFTPPPLPPFGLHVPPPFGSAPPALAIPPPPIPYPSIGRGAPPHVSFAAAGAQKRAVIDADPLAVPPHMRTRPWAARNTPPQQPLRSNSWSVGPLAGPASGDDVFADEMYPYVTPDTDGEHHENAQERKAHLDAAKAYYRAQKESFKKEKEERRRLRRESAEKRAEEGFK